MRFFSGFGIRTPRTRAESVADAVRSAEAVVNALPWPATRGVLEKLGLEGKILLDCTNPLKPDPSGLEVGATTSGGELVAGWAKGAKVVKIFNTTGYANMANPSYGGQPITIFYCCDNADAKRIAAGLARDIGFDPVDAGCWSPTRCCGSGSRSRAAWAASSRLSL